MCAKIPGFGVRKTPKTGKVVFFVRRSVSGQDRRETIGRYPAIRVREARILARRRIADLERETSGCPACRQATHTTSEGPRGVVHDHGKLDQILSLVKPPEKRKVMTLGELADKIVPQWFEGLAEATVANKRGVLRAEVLPRWGDTPIDEIKPHEMEEWYRTFDTNPHYGALAAQTVKVLLKKAHKRGWLETLPMFDIKYKKPRIRCPLEQKGVKKLVGVLETVLTKTPMHAQANTIIAILNTGERAQAAASLHTSEVDYKKQCITKRRKFGKVEPLAISKFAASFLKSIAPKGGGYFFPHRFHRGKHINTPALSAFLKRVCEKNKITTTDGRTPGLHNLRHTYATLLEEQGLPLSHIQRLLGHSSMETTMRYVHGNVAQAKLGADRLKVTRVRLKK